MIRELGRGRAKGGCGVLRPREAAGAGHRGSRDGLMGGTGFPAWLCSGGGWEEF